MTARPDQRRPRRPALAVSLAIADAELADRVRSLLDQGDFEVLGIDDPHPPQVSVTDRMPETLVEVPVLLLTESGDVLDALQAGASAVLESSADGPSLRAALRAAALGLTALSPQARQRLLDGAGVGADGETEDEPPAPELTPRELQVLALLVEGASNKAIARRLGITPSTAKFHVASIVAKLGARGRTDAVAKAMRLGLVMV